MRSMTRLAALLGLLIGMNGCGDAAPTGANAPKGGGRELYPPTERPVLVGVLTRTTPLANDIIVSAPIGKTGGAITVPGTGMTITFAANAVIPPNRQKAVTVTVKALKGDKVAYEFEPHGITFQAPVTITQALAGTNASQYSLSSLEGAYFTSTTELSSTSADASVVEFRATSVNTAGTSVSFGITHFSGYLVATGRQQ
jgi:hypothetical protein